MIKDGICRTLRMCCPWTSVVLPRSRARYKWPAEAEPGVIAHHCWRQQNIVLAKMSGAGKSWADRIPVMDGLAVPCHSTGVATPNYPPQISHSKSTTPNQPPQISHLISVTPDQPPQIILLKSSFPNQSPQIILPKSASPNHLSQISLPALAEPWAWRETHPPPGHTKTVSTSGILCSTKPPTPSGTHFWPQSDLRELNGSLTSSVLKTTLLQ